MKVEIVTVREVNLRTIPYVEWPEEAKRLARIFLEQEMRARQSDAFLRERVIARIDAHGERSLLEI